MGGLTMTFRKRETRYFPAGELVEAPEAIAGFDEPEDRLLADHPRMRRILVRGRPGWPLHRYYLHWSDGTDLESLDRRVASGAATEADFAGAVVGEPLSITHTACGAELRIIALDVVLPLFDDGIERSRVHSYQTACPVCGGRLASNVLEFIVHKAS
ncbi:hypothetical protein RKE30_02165 [Streptomyces sp. Li-HN-5-11]|uniref:hypothetical protein n=1 Tax=Streptomyces sp. Li-HN-5-11 TaxID=3075432 RepID=UPI0028A62E76|nr:hypothetical protein [Streptomyces sp. Li-HN-5-11]WNM29289.1 hypothetical protein RKE30_02165 [Streptomyces sp. Li-HN-5-11]